MASLLPDVLLIFVPTVFVLVGIRMWRYADPSAEKGVQGDSLYAGDVNVKFREANSGLWGAVMNGSGWLQLAIRGELVAVRSPGWPRYFAILLGFHRNVLAPRMEVGSAQIGRRFGAPGIGREWIVLRGFTRKNRYIELAFYPRDDDLARLRDALLRAGARPPGTLISPVGEGPRRRHPLHVVPFAAVALGFAIWAFQANNAGGWIFGSAAVAALLFAVIIAVLELRENRAHQAARR